jgi:hypothetical protein
MAINIPLITTFDSKGISKAIQQFKKLENGTQKSAFVVKNLENNMGKAFKSLAMVGAGAALAGGAIAKVLLSQAYEAKKVTAETNAIIAATGGAARISADGVAALSEKLSMQIGVDDELIQKSANLLLTFKQVQNVQGEGNDIFSQAVTLAQDLGSVFGSAESAAMQLGKALSDPVAGITALRRAGINFTESQKETIKNLVEQGDLLGAQKLILDEVASQVGGTAAASATGFDRMKVAIENVAEQLGTLLLPYFEDLANWITETVVPVISEFANIVGEQGLGAAIGNLSGKFLDWIGNLKGTGEMIYWVVAAIAALTIGIYAFAVAEAVATVAVAAFGVAWNASGIGLIVTVIAMIVVAIVAMAIKWQWLRDVLKDVWNAIVTGLQGYINVMLEAWETLINGIIWGINKMIDAWNFVSWGTDIEKLDEVNLKLDITGAKIDSVTDKTKRLNLAWGQLSLGDITALGLQAQSDYKPPRSLGSGSGSSKTIKTAAELLKDFITKLKGYGSELKALASATKEIETANKNLVKAIKDVASANEGLASAQSAVSDALEHFNQVTRGYGVGSAQAAEAQRNLSQAQRDGIRANIGLANAQQAVAEAQQKIIDLQKATDPRTIQEAQDNITKATYDLADAQKELDRAQRRGNVREIEMASIALRDAQNNLTDAQTELADANEAADPQALIDAQEELTEAELAAEEARLALIESTDAITEAQNLLNEAINGAVVGSDAYNEALTLLNEARAEEASAAQAVIDAIDREAEARDRVTEAIDREAEAKRELAEAEKELNTARGGLTAEQIASAQASTGINAPALDFSGVDWEALGRLMGLSGRANGGSVMAGTPYIVGERGQEMFVPNSNGKIIPNHELSQGGMNIIVNVAGSVTTERQLVEQIRVGLLKAQKSGRAMVL